MSRFHCHSVEQPEPGGPRARLPASSNPSNISSNSAAFSSQIPGRESSSLIALPSVSMARIRIRSARSAGTTMLPLPGKAKCPASVAFRKLRSPSFLFSGTCAESVSAGRVFIKSGYPDPDSAATATTPSNARSGKRHARPSWNSPKSPSPKNNAVSSCRSRGEATLPPFPLKASIRKRPGNPASSREAQQGASPTSHRLFTPDSEGRARKGERTKALETTAAPDQ